MATDSPSSQHSKAQLYHCQISGGVGHSLLVTDSGVLYSFGDGSDGQLGNGSFDEILKAAKSQYQEDERLQAVDKNRDHNNVDLDYSPRSSAKPLQVKIGAMVTHRK